MSVFVDQDVVRFDVPDYEMCIELLRGGEVECLVCSPVNESKVMDRFDREHTFRHVEASNVFGECVILYEHRHQVAPGKKFHDQVQVCWILERVKELHHPG
jgi:hypothetical protein